MRTQVVLDWLREACTPSWGVRCSVDGKCRHSFISQNAGANYVAEIKSRFTRLFMVVDNTQSLSICQDGSL